jgi:peroxiredoxin
MEYPQTLKINDMVPMDLQFSAYDPKKDEETKVSFKEYKDKWLAVVFYPADFTFVCPTELEELADLHKDFQKEGADILSVSRDTVFVHKAWHDHSPAIGKIEYKMAADPAGVLSHLFGVAIDNPADGDNGLTLRGSFLISPEGQLKTIEIHNNDVGRSGKELLRKIRAAKFVREHKGNVCPASWEPGEDTLKPGMDLVGKI